MPDSQVNYLQTTPSGDVRAVFPGGVQMTAEQPEGTTAPADKSVSWTRQADGSVVAHVKGSTDSDTSGTSVQMATYKPPFTGNSPFRFALIEAHTAPDGQSPRAEVFVEMSDETDTGLFVKRIFNSKQESQFVQTATLRRLIMTTGTTSVINNGAAGAFPSGMTSLLTIVVQPQQIGTAGQGGWNCDHGGGPGAFTIYNNTGFNIPFDWIALGQA